MIASFLHVARLWLFLVCEQLLLFPLAAMIYGFTGVNQAGLFLCAYLLLDLLAMLAREWLPRRFRPWILVVGILLGTALCLWASPSLFFRILVPFLLAIILWHGVHMVESGGPGGFFSSFIMLGFMLYPVITWVFLRSDRFVSWVPVLGITGTIGILLSLVMVNRQQIRDAGRILERRIHLPSTLMRKNAIYLFVFILIVLAGAAWEFFGRMAMGLFTLVGRAITAFFTWLGNLVQRPEAPPEEMGNGQQEQMMLPEAEDPSPLMEAIQNIILWVVFTAVMILLIWGLYKLIRKLVPTIRLLAVKLFAFLRHFFIGEKTRRVDDLGFVDEVESLLKKNESNLDAARRWITDRFDHEPGYGSMKTDEARIRWLFRNHVRKEIRKGYPYNPADTPAETLAGITAWKSRHRVTDPEGAARLYGRIRYAEEAATTEMVKAMKRSCD